MAPKSGANDLTGSRPNNPGKRFQKRALSRPVWADNGGEACRRKLAGQPLKCVFFAIAHGEIADRNPPLSLRTTVYVGRAGIVAAIELTGEGCVCVIS